MYFILVKINLALKSLKGLGAILLLFVTALLFSQTSKSSLEKDYFEAVELFHGLVI